MQTVHILIEGEVQGVFYRATAKKIADRLAVTGWIQNIPGGNVEAVVSGSEEHLKQFIDWCREGPPLSKVNDVIISYQKETVFEDFSILRYNV